MSDVSMGAVRMGGAVASNALSVGGGIRVGQSSFGGNIRMANGGSSPVVNAQWGSIEGNIESQTDLMEALGLKADASALSTKLTTPSGTNGQFMSLVNGVWTAVNLPVYEGGVE